MSPEQLREAQAAGLTEASGVQHKGKRPSFDLAANVIVEWPVSYPPSMFHSFADQSASFPRFKTLSSVVLAESDEGNDNGGGSDDGSSCTSLPSIKSVSTADLGSDAEDELCTPCHGKSLTTLPMSGMCFCCARAAASCLADVVLDDVHHVCWTSFRVRKRAMHSVQGAG